MEFDCSAKVREHLVQALRADLVGPFAGNEAEEEVWDLAPSKRYLCGFLVPSEQEQEDDPTEDDAFEAGDDLAENAQDDPQVKRRPVLPSSIGLSVLLPPGEDDVMHVEVGYADYVAEEQAADGAGRKRRSKVHWRRQAREPIAVTVGLQPNFKKRLGDSGLTLHGNLEVPGHMSGLPELPPGTRALSLFIVNDRKPVLNKKRRDEGYVFQVSMSLRHDAGLLPSPNLAGQAADDWDDRVMDLQFREQRSYASGHGVAVADIVHKGQVVGARTEWIPTAKVKRVTTRDVAGVVVSMGALAKLDSAEAVRSALDGIPEQYGEWLCAQKLLLSELEANHSTGKNRVQVGKRILNEEAHRAKERIAEGIALLATNPEARRAFGIANQAMDNAARRRSPDRYTEGQAPSWRLFQLAFVLLNLPAIVNPEHQHRETVELIFFPTGGGKTEAYLGVIGFTLVWRRMSGTERPDMGLGVAVVLRYTLRLLTLDQLGRAATLICALELLREPWKLGEVRFSLGLWVGKSATANKLTEVARQITDYKNGSSNLSPFPLAACPWCNKDIHAGCMKVEPSQKKPVEALVWCSDFQCEFSARKRGLPVLFVDEQIYRELPSFLVATVDKFAMMPWRGESGALFGQVTRRMGKLFIGPSTPLPSTLKDTSVKLPDGLRPPELIVQDELHLISGPLGTMVGLYETAIETLACVRKSDGTFIKPKIIASTATVKRAHQQILALYGRDDTAMFPPPGIDDSESFFSKVDDDANGRLYLGVAAGGRSAKAVLVTVYAALLTAAEKCMDRGGDMGQPADPYMSLVGYFNSLRELGGMRRLVEDLIRARSANRGDLLPIGRQDNPWMQNRELKKQPVELTSRESTSAISKSKDLLGKRCLEDGFIPVVLASNMISVGVDIDRLGLMVVAGQPKSTSEYIQASSRVGRDDKRPGLVVTHYNLNKPRDRSYYEHFVDYHESFYRYVEPTSVTPFSGPALERGLAGCLIAMIRHGNIAMSPAGAAMDLEAHRDVAAAAVDTLVERAARIQVNDDSESVKTELRILCQRIVDRWSTFIADAKGGGAQRSYSPYDKERKDNPMLFTALDEQRARDKGIPDRDHFVAPTSMRDVEPTVHLWLRPAGSWSTGGGRS